MNSQVNVETFMPIIILTTPLRDYNSVNSESSDTVFPYSAYEIQGKRAYMEDRYVVRGNLNGLN